MSDTDFPAATDADQETAAPNADARPDDAAPAGAGRAIKDGGGKLAAQATDKARFFADQGKAKAGETLDQFSQLLHDAAGQVDEKISTQYGQYARTAADQVANFSNTLKAKDVDDLVEDVRGFVKASPGIAVGIAAAVGFALARVVQSGIDSAPGDTKA